MILDVNGLKGLKTELAHLDEVGDQLGFIRWQWDYYRATYDFKYEDEKNNDLFKHIKSFEYLKTKNYSLLTRFVESEDFQVHIYGHSCGLSDRTMLNQIEKEWKERSRIANLKREEEEKHKAEIKKRRDEEVEKFNRLVKFSEQYDKTLIIRQIS